MYVHFFLKKCLQDGNNEDDEEEQSFLGQLKSYVLNYSPKPFYYNIAGYNFNLEEIKHGLLRNNLKSPYNYTRSLNGSDERIKLLNEFFDPRVIFVCLDYPECLEQIDSFEGTDEEVLDKELEHFVSELIEQQVSIDLDQNIIQLPKLLQTYIVDFESSEEQIL